MVIGLWFTLRAVMVGLEVDYLDGLPHAFGAVVTQIAKWAEQIWPVKGFVVHYVTVHAPKKIQLNVALWHWPIYQWILSGGHVMSQGDIDDWHEALVLRGLQREGPRGCGGGGPDTCCSTRLSSLLVDKGVPEDRSDERALAGIQALGGEGGGSGVAGKEPMGRTEDTGVQARGAILVGQT